MYMYIHRGHDGDNYYNYSTSVCVCVVIELHVVHSVTHSILESESVSLPLR